MVKTKNKYMLSKLFGSAARVKILKLFLMHPQEKYYIRQLARDLSLQLNSVRRELENLESFGVLTSDMPGPEETEELSSIEEFLSTGTELKKNTKTKTVKKGKKGKEDENGKSDKKYYRTNTDFVLYEEIKALFVKAQILYEKDFVNKMHSIGKPKLLILTGFFVNSDVAPVDILLVGKINREKLLKQIAELEAELGREINFTLMGHKEFKYRRDITDVFLYGILEGKKVIVIDEYGL